MVRLIAPNGAEFEASDEAAPLLVAAGWTQKDAAKPKRKAAGKSKKEK